MGSLVSDIRTSADCVANALSKSGYRADFSLQSLKEVDRFFDEQSQNGQGMPGGLLADQVGPRIFAIGSYIGETIRRLYGGTWQCNDDDPRGEINVALNLPGGGVIWPVQRAIKRFKNGPEDEIYGYGYAVTEKLSPISNPPSAKAWWKFW